jgi:hypothetical protein
MRQPLPTAEVDDERSSSDPVEEAIRNADLAALWSAIAELPKPQRDALLLREFGGLSYAELAGALAVSDSAVESLLFRARHGVRARLEAAYAALSGASWVEALARLAGGIGGGMAPVAAKVAVVSVGAAVATGGYVAAPHVLHSESRPAGATRPAHVRLTRSPAAPAAVLLAQTIPTVASAALAHGSRGADHSGDDHSGSGSGRGTDDGESSTTSASDGSGSGESGKGESSGEGRSATSERSGKDSSGSGSGSDSVDSHDGASASPESSGDGSGESSGHGSGDGSGGGDDHGGGVTTTAPNPAVTVTIPVAEPSPPVGEPVPTTGG